MVHIFWPLMTEKRFSLPLTKVDIHFGHVRMYAMPYPISWIIFILDLEPSNTDNLSRLMGKPTICIGENKEADQLRDQRLCFRYSDSTIPLLLKSEISSF